LNVAGFEDGVSGPKDDIREKRNHVAQIIEEVDISTDKQDEGDDKNVNDITEEIQSTNEVIKEQDNIFLSSSVASNFNFVFEITLLSLFSFASGGIVKVPGSSILLQGMSGIAVLPPLASDEILLNVKSLKKDQAHDICGCCGAITSCKGQIIVSVDLKLRLLDTFWLYFTTNIA
jgi:hypothetical protein